MESPQQELRRYIDSFRTWLEQHAEPVCQNDHAEMLQQWKQELSDADKLLARQPELPIAMLGPSQQGKSSLINALLGENVLAVGGAVGACTCVITSVHYRAAAGFKAEIEFITLDDWRTELQAIQAALASLPSVEEDSELDRDELEANQKAALEKFGAVYRTNTAEDLEKLLNAEELGLPLEITQAMQSGKPLLIEEATAQTLRNRVRRYLVGREQHEDGQFWPLISRVRIYGNFEVLSNGVVLVDLPGLNDPNPAREQVTKRYLEEARYLWLVCNSQTGIDRVFTQILRDGGFLFRLFIEGRLNAFSVVATRADDINLAAVLEQMGISPDDFDGDYAAPLAFRRREIAAYIQRHLLNIAHDIATRAESAEQQTVFFDRICAIQAFSVSTSAYLHAKGRMPLYQGMRLSPEESHLPHLIEHLHAITREHSYKVQVEAASRQLQLLYDQAHRFFLDQILRLEQDSEKARQEWAALCQLSTNAAQTAQTGLQRIQIRSEESLKQRCEDFSQRLADFDARAVNALQATFAAWGNLNWRSLHAAVKRRGEWFTTANQREINLNRDIARAYLDLLPFVWDEFFGSHLSSLVEDTAQRTQAEIQGMALILMGGMEMLHHQPEGIQESIVTSLRTARESFDLQSEQAVAALMAQIQRTRQSLSSGMVETASVFMQQAYTLASQVRAGTGIKQRILDVLIKQAVQQVPALFINMRKELSEGVTTMKASMKPQLSQIVEKGERIVNQFQQNMTNHQVLTPEQRGQYQSALDRLPKSEIIL
jgi:hypothetical protein